MRTICLIIFTAAMAGMVSFKPIDMLTISSTAFSDNGIIPPKYSCKGQEVSPPLTISQLPSGTKTLAIIVHDPDAPIAGGMTHWVVWNIKPASSIPEAYKNNFIGLNGENNPSYKGMCPAVGTGTHHYHFKVYALDTRLDISDKTDKQGLEKAMEGHVLASGDLVGLFSDNDNLK